MPDPVHYDMWDALAAVGIACGSALTTLGGLIGIQKKNGLGVKTAHDKSRAEIRDLQNRCRDLENDVENLQEKVKTQGEVMKEYERKKEAFETLIFAKLDTMGETLVAIRVAVGIAEGR